MDRYAALFEKVKRQGKIAFCPFAVIGHPTMPQSLKRVRAYLRAGADCLEFGIPFSDPSADGPVVQEANALALKGGATPPSALEFIQQVRALTNVPIGLLVYYNIVLQYGVPRFVRDARCCGVDSILIADLPLEESLEFVQVAQKNGVHPIFIVSERTTNQRLTAISKHASGFLYVVSASGTTGVRDEMPPTLPKLLKRLRAQTNLPLMVGFGISNASHVTAIRKAGAQGVIVGSALVRLSHDYPHLARLLRSLSAAAGRVL